MVKFSESELNRLLSIRGLKYCSGFLDARYKFNVGCVECGYVFSTSLYNKSGCIHCKRTKEFFYYVGVINELGFMYVSGKYETKLSELLVSCTTCKYSFISSIKRIARGDGCPRCSRKEKLSIDKIRENISGRGIEILSTEYVNSGNDLLWRCVQCNTSWYAPWNSIREGHGCPECNKLVGEKNPRWRGGSPYIYPKEWNRTLKELIRNRDNRRCQFPGCVYSDIGNKKLHVHHINGIKDICSPDNLISLCNSHHQYVETHNPREWEDYFYDITSDHEYR